VIYLFFARYKLSYLVLGFNSAMVKNSIGYTFCRYF